MLCLKIHRGRNWKNYFIARTLPDFMLTRGKGRLYFLYMTGNSLQKPEVFSNFAGFFLLLKMPLQKSESNGFDILRSFSSFAGLLLCVSLKLSASAAGSSGCQLQLHKIFYLKKVTQKSRDYLLPLRTPISSTRRCFLAISSCLSEALKDLQLLTEH